MMRLLRRRLRNDRGTAAVELAIVLPVFLLLVFGALSFGLAMSTKGLLNQAAADGARAGIGQASPLAAGTAQAKNELTGSGLPVNNATESASEATCPTLGGSTECLTVTTTGSPILNVGFSFFGAWIGVPSTLTSTATVEIQ